MAPYVIGTVATILLFFLWPRLVLTVLIVGGSLGLLAALGYMR